jgi:hypothetical protein
MNSRRRPSPGKSGACLDLTFGRIVADIPLRQGIDE